GGYCPFNAFCPVGSTPPGLRQRGTPCPPKDREPDLLLVSGPDVLFRTAGLSVTVPDPRAGSLGLLPFFILYGLTITTVTFPTRTQPAGAAARRGGTLPLFSRRKTCPLGFGRSGPCAHCLPLRPFPRPPSPPSPATSSWLGT